jgi:DNA-binding NarL/FixJ family response regulator
VLERAECVFAEIGAAIWAARAQAELSRIGGRAPSPLDLTASERKVAEVVAAGATNREVAGQLFLSVSTVEAILSRVYRKLGVRSRTEMARIVRETRPVTEDRVH